VRALVPLALLALLLLAACSGGPPPAPPAGTAATATATAPDGMRFAASSRGTVYYAVACEAWKRLDPGNVRFFATVEEARAAGLRPSSQAGCGDGDVATQVTQEDAGGSGAVGAPLMPAEGDACVVARIVDGDTLTCDGGERIRLLLIDAPELSQAPWGQAARRELAALAPPGTPLRLEHDVQRRDRYGRTLAYLWLPDGRLVNEELLRAGVAVVSVYPPNVRHVDRFRAVVAEAQSAGAGLWGTPAFDCTPRDHRAGRC
jgi:endonuclease YncB( thermonuclease family)